MASQLMNFGNLPVLNVGKGIIMKNFDILCYPIEDASGWEMEICHDLGANQLNPSVSRRKMILQILQKCGVAINQEDFEYLTDFAIDQLLLDNGINVVFHDCMD